MQIKVPNILSRIQVGAALTPQNSTHSLPPIGMKRQMPVVKQPLIKSHPSESQSESQSVEPASLMQLLRDNTHAARVHMKQNHFQGNGKNKNISYYSVSE
ncbi:Hypothetical_protein [Hexamita inflata]|uniref:Hypothetical_protein n=1 Tax=Hexamita inflata TaxID=28002 RepID=A0AA86RHS2_9EUKA|nr:Hypothetical protein HINF_LOCUS54865 [Hexamita inflata]